MRRFQTLIMLLCLTGTMSVHAQVGVNTDGSAPHSSAMLDVKSTAKGFLPPRMSRNEMLSIVSPEPGLVVFCTDCIGTGSLATFINNQWNTLAANCLVPVAPVAAIHVANASQIEWKWNSVPNASGYRWNSSNSLTGSLDLGMAQSYIQTGLSCNTAFQSYIWSYNDCGLSQSILLTQSTAMNPQNPAAGTAVATPSSILWNWGSVAGATGYKWGVSSDYSLATDMGNATSYLETGLNCNQMQYRYVWSYNSCGHSGSKILNQSTSTLPAAPVMTTHTATASQIVWNWNPVAGAAGYKWNTVNNYSTASDLGAVTTKTENSLPCNTTQFRYFWAYSACGNSTVTMTSQKTAMYPAAPSEAVHIPSVNQIVWNWQAVPGATGYKWNTVNNYGTATNLGNVLTRTEPGLTCNTPYSRYLWAYNSCGASVAQLLEDTTGMSGTPAAPAAGTHTSTTSQVVWDWNPVSGATGYKWSTVDDYFSAQDMGTATGKTETGLTCATSYDRYVWAYSACGVSLPVTLTKSTVWCLWICGMPITDNRDGKVYGTVSIGSQCWLAQNLNTGFRIDYTYPQTSGAGIQKYCMSNLESNCDIYGGLYQWNELMNYTTSSNANPSGRQGICPNGWHVPSDAECCEMENFLDSFVSCQAGEYLTGQDAGGQLKETGTSHWNAPNQGALNTSGFTGLPGGLTNGALVGGFRDAGYFATTTEVSTGISVAHSLHSDSQLVGHTHLEHEYSRSVRCVRD